MATKMEKLYAELAEYFVFDKQKYTLEEFFSDIKTFKDLFKQVKYLVKVISNFIWTCHIFRLMIQY